MKYLDYIAEREGFQGFENESGFVTYKIENDECYLRDMYVVPEHRRKRCGLRLLMKVENAARDAKCKFVTTTVRPSAFGSTESLKAILWAGFELAASYEDALVLKKELF